MADIKSAFAAIDARLILIALISGAAWTVGSKLAERAVQKAGNIATETVSGIGDASAR